MHKWDDIVVLVIYMDNNICKFISTTRHDEGINIINFVYERVALFDPKFNISSTYSLCLVTCGTGVLHTPMENFQIRRGDLFVLLSAKPYYIENTGALQYIYICFTGSRAPGLLDRLPVSRLSPVFHDYDFLIPIWENTIEICLDSNTDLLCEGLLLYALGFLCREKAEKVLFSKPNNLLKAKEYVDMNYTDAELTLQSVSDLFSYNPKYFSSAFKKLVRTNFSDYLHKRRLNHALMLMGSGITNVTNLAELCGYKDPLYFSRSFKKHFGCSPTLWLSKKQQTNG